MKVRSELFASAIAVCLTVSGFACPIEREWGLDAFLNGAFSHWDAGAFKQAHVIAWQAEEDDRPLYVEECVAVIERKKKWILVRLFRHPKDRNSPGWELAVVNDAPQTPFVEFANQPTPDDLTAFLKTSWWSFEPGSGFRMVRSGICEATLKRLFGITPDALKSGTKLPFSKPRAPLLH